ncbi:MAG: DUF4876 domain-containing protein [Ignavibacteriaceae bacterium]|nr:DUF4876 domain-containing protein [Ignavibacteriaceae bacterium]
MNTININRLYQLSFALIISVLSFNCSDILGTDPKPEKTEREIEFQITLKDNSGFMQTLFGSDKVRNAEVLLQSNLLGSSYHLYSDSNGVIKIKGIISDKYIITATRIMHSGEMQIISGTTVTNVKLVNKKTRILELNAASPANIDLEMDMVVGGSPLIISEIYACGPQGSGLYYHDKYVEVFNQSDSVLYLDKMMIAIVYTNSNTGLHYRDDPEFIHSKSIWIFPGTGKDYPIQPGQFVLCAEDAIDHRMNAPNSVDLSHADFEFYKDDAPDIDNPVIPNMIKIYQTAGNDWLIGGETGALILSNFSADSLLPFDDQFLIPYRSVFDGVEYKADPTKLDKKILNEGIDAGSTGGIQFYTGKSMERILISDSNRKILKDENNSSVDFMIINAPSPGKYH